MKAAIVHDYLNQYGGAERVVEVLHEVFPKAPIYTSIYLSNNMPDSFRNMDIRTSFMQNLPFLNKHFKKYLLLYPKAMKSFNFKEYDLVISSSSTFAKGINVEKKTCHICYCYTPTRFIWDHDNYIAKENLGRIFKAVLPLAVRKLKKRDLEAAKSVDYFIAISEIVKKRIKKYYGRESIVIYPPVETSKFMVSGKEKKYFLVVSRLNPYKKIDLVIEAFNKLPYELKIVGGGPYMETLKKMAKSENIKFLGKISDEKLTKIYSGCKAFIFPGVEDFGIAPLEAQASGRPVIAYAAGGALETVVEETTGLFFKRQSAGSLIELIEKFMKIENKFKPEIIRGNALKFDKEIFKSNLKKFINNKFL